MSNAIAIPDEDFDGMPSEEIRRRFADGFAMTKQGLLLMARAVRVLDDRGEDLGDVPTGLLVLVRRIAAGQLDAGLVTRFIGHNSLIQKSSTLLLRDQHRLAEGQPVRLLVYTPDGGSLTHKLADPRDLTPEQVRQVFARDHIRDDAEQSLWLDQQRTEKVVRVPDRVGELKIDKERGGVWLKRTFISQVDLAQALSVLKK